jgi:hypothetical protein
MADKAEVGLVTEGECLVEPGEEIVACRIVGYDERRVVNFDLNRPMGSMVVNDFNI